MTTRKKSAKTSKSRRKTQPSEAGHSRSMWSGSISFGLLNIPVSLVSAKEEAPISFSLLDKRNFGHIGYRQYNKTTGKAVPANQIAKGFEYKKGKYVIVTDEDFRRANPHAVSTIDIEDFIELKELDPMLFDRPYYLNPAKNGEKGYRLLRDVMQRTKKVAIGRVVLFRKQRLVAIVPRGEYLVLETLRFAHEVLTVNEMEGTESRLNRVRISSREIEMAESLVEGMTAKWNPDKYKDTYHDDLMKLIKAKAKHGGVTPAEEAEDLKEAATENRGAAVLDLMPLLKKSLEAEKHGHKRASRGAS